MFLQYASLKFKADSLSSLRWIIVSMSISKALPPMLGLIHLKDCSKAITLEDDDIESLWITLNRSMFFERVYRNLNIEATNKNYYDSLYEMQKAFLSINKGIKQLKIWVYLLVFIICLSPKDLGVVDQSKFIYCLLLSFRNFIYYLQKS